MRKTYSTKCILCEQTFYVAHNKLICAKYCSVKCRAFAKKEKIESGQVYNRLTILKEIKPKIKYSGGRQVTLRMVECLCECGKITVIRWTMIRSGNTQSCGCKRKDQYFINLGIGRPKKYAGSGIGYSKHPLYGIWGGIIDRCYNPKRKAYNDYGMRGIKTSERWLNIENFIEDMYPTYIKGLEIERVDNDGWYEKSNCIWGTRVIQANNKRTTIKVMYKGHMKALSLICRELQLNRRSIYGLMRYYKITFEDALNKYK